MIPRYAGKFENARIYEVSYMGSGMASAGLALPGLGIIVGTRVFLSDKSKILLMHEYGHFLQAQKTGWILFYLFIGPMSLLSAYTRGFGKGHQHFWTEKWANALAKAYFNVKNWPESEFPTGPLPPRIGKYFN